MHGPSLTIRYFSCPLTRTVLMVYMGGPSGSSLASCVNSSKEVLTCSLWYLSYPLSSQVKGWGHHGSHPQAVAKEGLQEGRLAHSSGSQHLAHKHTALCLPFFLI